MKIGVIGLGNIAQKAYLPTYSECRHDKKSLISMALQKPLGP